MKRPKLSTDNASEVADATRRFVREADTWSSLTHDNILPFYGVMKISNEMYLISPWMEYGDLSRFLADRLSFLKTPGDLRDRDKNPRKIAYRGFIESDALHGVASGLAYLHTHDVVVHGDLKASNVLLNEQLMPRICDFGLSKIKDGHSATSTGMQGAGSWRWMSPEVMDGGPKTFESDIYAFGMTIVEVLTGSVPLPDVFQVPFIRAILNGQRPPREPTSRLEHDFTEWWSIASVCWVSDPSKRPTAGHIVKSMEGTVPTIHPAPTGRNVSELIKGLSVWWTRHRL
ncbi:hypothetical protein FRB95_014087 [Tulasnella sp. JGI-2019a]|nr:hypothetical protein FRB95_014087 [Tulasnella sp. JGI-2019a]